MLSNKSYILSSPPYETSLERAAKNFQKVLDGIYRIGSFAVGVNSQKNILYVFRHDRSPLYPKNLPTQWEGFPVIVKTLSVRAL